MIFSRITLKDGINPVERVWSHVSTEDYALHQTVWHLLATNGGGRDFLFRTEKIRGNPVIYTVSHNRPFASDNSPWYVDAKPYDPNILSGERIARRNLDLFTNVLTKLPSSSWASQVILGLLTLTTPETL
ncbi:MAG: type I-E CRISPR-associated protein Cas6/Cse3/CasE [Nitrospirae bacterium]|nr:type I-E CRISPR-associated protein Cas6/Cse3/CasE [Nitrospirota bacterium]